MNDFEETSIATFTRILRGDASPSDLAVQYLPRLRAFIHARLGDALRSKESPTDIVQSVCRELCASEERLSFDVEAEFRAWLFAAALNKVREKARYWTRKKRSTDSEEELGEERGFDDLAHELSRVMSPSRVAIAREEAERLEAAILDLPEHYREVIALRRIAGLPYAAVAKQIGKTEEATRKIFGRALRQLAQTLNDEHE